MTLATRAALVLGPTGSALALPVFLYGIMGGAAFGFQGVFEDIFHRSADASLDALADHPFAANLLLWIPGPVMPLSLFALGAVLGRKRLVPLWTAALLCAGALAFPLSRIPRVDLVANLADAVLVVAFTATAHHLRTVEIRRIGTSTAMCVEGSGSHENAPRGRRDGGA